MNYLFISSHIDDAPISCGATMAKLSKNNKLYHLSISNIYNGIDLINEFNDCNKVLGVECFSLNYRTRKFHLLSDDILQDLYRYKENKYDFIFSPNKNDYHSDHSIVGKASERVFKNFNLLAYLGNWNTRTIKTNYFSKVTKSNIEQKIEALKCFHSQQHNNYINDDYIWANARNMGVMAGCEFAEGFEVINLYDS